MKTYKVWVSFNGCALYEVEANDRDEARDIAMDMADPFDCEEWDFDTAFE